MIRQYRLAFHPIAVGMKTELLKQTVKCPTCTDETPFLPNESMNFGATMTSVESATSFQKLGYVCRRPKLTALLLPKNIITHTFYQVVHILKTLITIACTQIQKTQLRFVIMHKQPFITNGSFYKFLHLQVQNELLSPVFHLIFKLFNSMTPMKDKITTTALPLYEF